VKVPFMPTGTVSSGGLMMRLVRVARVTARRALPENPPDMAVMVVVPGLLAAATPPDTEATFGLLELQVAVPVRSRVPPSE
jgi:hypothetical protein